MACWGSLESRVRACVEVDGAQQYWVQTNSPRDWVKQARMEGTGLASRAEEVQRRTPS